MTKTDRPPLQLSNRQRKVPICLPLLQRQLETALRLLTPSQARKLPPAIEITYIGHATMCAVHRDFLDDPTPTDVITFLHGEILVCPEVARQQSRHFGRTVTQETLLYGIHGILHLVGYKDKTPTDFKRMSVAQEKLLDAVLKACPK